MPARTATTLAVTLLLAFIAYLALAVDAPAPAPAAPASEPAAAAPIAVSAATAAGARDEAAAAPTVEAEVEQPFDPAPVLVDPWPMRFLVVDEYEQPVADAVVMIWLATKVQHRPRSEGATSSAGNHYAGHADLPAYELRTDADGCARVALGFEAYAAAAAKDGVGRSGLQYLLYPGAATSERRLVLRMPVPLHGVVLRSNGTPAAGARVTAQITGPFSFRQLSRPWRPDPVLAGADGRFAVDVARGFDYALGAEADGEHTFTERIQVLTASPPAVVLTFPGAIAIRGVVVGVDDQPVSDAVVEVWREGREGDPPGGRSEVAQTTTTDDGRFCVCLREHARYQLIAMHQGSANSRAVWAATTPVRPFADVQLQMLRLATIRGRVEHTDGSPFASIRVDAVPKAGATEDGSAASEESRFGRVRRTSTDADGSFELHVHPDTNWTVQAMPDRDNPRLCVAREGVAPGTDDVVIRIGDSDLGCVVQATVSRADGQPLGVLGIQLQVYRDGRLVGLDFVQPEVQGNRFTLPALPLGREYSLQLCARDAGGRPVAGKVLPFTTDRRELLLDVRLEGVGGVPVTVLDDHGAPAPGVELVIGAGILFGGVVRGGQPVDADGRATLACPAGKVRLSVFRDGRLLCAQQLLVTPRPNAEVVMRLPAAK